MSVSRDRKENSNNVGLRIICSEKILIALLHVVLALGLAYMQSENSANLEIPETILENQPSQ